MNFFETLFISIFGAGITLLGGFFLQRENYKKDYYKKIIDKRMSVYESAYKGISMLQIINQSSLGRKSHAALINRTRYSNLMVNMALGSIEGLWLGNDFSRKISTFNQFLYDKLGDFEENNDVLTDGVDPEMLQIAERHYDEISVFKAELRDQILSDLRILYEVEKFLNSKA